MRKTATVNLKGNEYAYVKDRLKNFREDCPNGLVETSPEVKSDGTIIFTARVLKDKSKPNSGEATGHAFGKASGDKAFEKLETVAVGRALALLGYLASGEIASADEMQEFIEYQQMKVDDAIKAIETAKTIDELKEVFMGLGNLMANEDVVNAKDIRKVALSESS